MILLREEAIADSPNVNGKEVRIDSLKRLVGAVCRLHSHIDREIFPHASLFYEHGNGCSPCLEVRIV